MTTTQATAAAGIDPEAAPRPSATPRCWTSFKLSEYTDKDSSQEHSILAAAIGAALVAAYRYQQLEDRGRLGEFLEWPA